MPQTVLGIGECVHVFLSIELAVCQGCESNGCPGCGEAPVLGFSSAPAVHPPSYALLLCAVIALIPHLEPERLER